jgi:hypothetical protein
MTSEQPRIRDVYKQYQQGRIPFERVVDAADQILARHAAARRSSAPAEQQADDRTP